MQITSPASGTEYGTNGAPEAVVTVTVGADDGEGSGVSEVRLTVNGSEFANNADAAAPFEWTLQVPPGGYMIGAIARDYVGLETEATPVAIGIDQEPPDPGDTSGADSSESGTGGSAGTGGEETGTGGAGGSVDEGPGGSAESDGVAGCGCSAENPRQGMPGSTLALVGLLLAWRRRRVLR